MDYSPVVVSLTVAGRGGMRIASSALILTANAALPPLIPSNTVLCTSASNLPSMI